MRCNDDSHSASLSNSQQMLPNSNAETKKQYEENNDKTWLLIWFFWLYWTAEYSAFSRDLWRRPHMMILVAYLFRKKKEMNIEMD